MRNEPVFRSLAAASAVGRVYGGKVYVNAYQSAYNGCVRFGRPYASRQVACLAGNRKPSYRVVVRFKRVARSAPGLRVVA
jgi:hypothetical protein